MVPSGHHHRPPLIRPLHSLYICQLHYHYLYLDELIRHSLILLYFNHIFVNSNLLTCYHIPYQFLLTTEKLQLNFVLKKTVSHASHNSSLFKKLLNLFKMSLYS